MKNKPTLRKRLTPTGLTLLCCFSVPFCVLLLIYSLMKVWPAGENSVLVLDLNAQYVYFFEELRSILTSGESILYSFKRALGGEFMGMFAYYLSSPFSLLVALFPKDAITEALYAMLLLKGGCTGLTFGWMLTKLHPELNRPSAVMLSSMYALSSFAVVMQHNIMWTDNLIAFPLLLVGMDALIRHGKFRLFVTALAYAVFSNFYIGYMTCLFAALWFFARYFMLSPEERNRAGESRHFLRSLGRIGLWSAVSLGICAVILLPTVYSLSFGKLTFTTPETEPAQMVPFADLLTKVFFGSYDSVRPTGMPFFYCGTVAMVLAPLYFFSREIPTRRKVAFAAVMAFFLASFNLNLLDILWHGMQHPNWLNARFAFLFLGVELLMTAEVLPRLPELGERAVLLCCAVWCAVLLLLDGIGYDDLPELTSVWASVFFLLLLGGLLAHLSRSSADPAVRKRIAAALCVIVIGELGANGYLMLKSLDKDVSYANRHSYRQMLDTYESAVDFVHDRDDAFYRAESLVHRKKNDNFALGLNGLSGSTSTLNARAVNLLGQFGYASYSHWSVYSGATAVTDALFGIKYVLADETDDKPVMSYLHELYDCIESTDEHIDVYENPYALSIAYAVKDSVLRFDVPPKDPADEEYLDPFTYMNKLLSRMTGEEITVWNRVRLDGSSEQGVTMMFSPDHRSYEADGTVTPALSFTLNIETEDPVYSYFPSDWPRTCTLVLDNKKIGKSFDDASFSIRELGRFEIGDRPTVALILEEADVYLKSGCTYFWSFDKEAFREAVALLQDGTMSAHSSRDDRIEGTITVPEGDGVIFTTIPYDRYWNVTVDGVKAETVPVLNDTLLAFPITPGEHEIIFTYRPVCVYAGAALSVLGLLFFGGAWAWDARKKNKTPTEVTI